MKAEEPILSLSLKIFSSGGESDLLLPLLWRSHGGSPSINVLIGPNGTYKSEILKSLAFYFSKRQSRRQAVLVNATNHGGNLPSRVIAATNAVFDKFPKAETGFSHLKRSVLSPNDIESNYYHFGAVANRRYFSARSMLFDSLASAISSLTKSASRDPILALFDFLNLEGSVELIFSLSERKISRSDIKGIDDESELKAVMGIIRTPGFQKNISRYSDRTHPAQNRGREVLRIPLDFTKRGKIDAELSEFLLGLEVLRRAKRAILEDANLRTKSGHPYPLAAASSGQSSLMLMCLSIASVLEENSLVLIDEPEIGLHPDWQHRFIGLLDKILSSKRNCRAVVATHSPGLIGGLPAERSSVIGLGSVNDRIIMRPIPFGAFGWSVDRILFDIFEVETARNEVVSHQLNALISAIAEPNVNRGKLRSSLAYLKKLKLPAGDPLLPVIEEAEKIAREEDGSN